MISVFIVPLLILVFIRITSYINNLHHPLEVEKVDFPLSLREAKELREELMEERLKEVQANLIDSLASHFPITLCEHYDQLLPPPLVLLSRATVLRKKIGPKRLTVICPSRPKSRNDQDALKTLQFNDVTVSTMLRLVLV